MITRNSEEDRAIVRSLEMLVEGGFSEDDSEDNIEKNIVSVVKFSKLNGADGSIVRDSRGGTGLMITRDGFVLTAYHNIEDYVSEWKERTLPSGENFWEWILETQSKYAVVDQQGLSHPIDTSFHAYSAEDDIALIKAITFGKIEPIHIKMIEENLREGDEIKVYGRTKQRQYCQFGTVIYPSYDVPITSLKTEERKGIVYDSFLTDAYGTYGFSGGVITNMRGHMAGIISYMQRCEGKEIGRIGGVKARYVTRLLRSVLESLKSNT